MRTLVLVLLFALLSGCAARPPRYQPPNGSAAQLTLKVDADFDTVWQAVIEVFAETMTSIETIEKASGFVAAARPIDFAGVSDLPQRVDFGSVNDVWASTHVQAKPQASSARVRYNVFVVRGATQQQVRVNAGWFGHTTANGTAPGGGVTSYRVELIGNSTGAFERLLLDAIAAKLQPRPTEIVVTQPFRQSTFTPEPRDYRDTVVPVSSDV